MNSKGRSDDCIRSVVTDTGCTSNEQNKFSEDHRAVTATITKHSKNEASNAVMLDVVDRICVALKVPNIRCC